MEFSVNKGNESLPLQSITSNELPTKPQNPYRERHPSGFARQDSRFLCIEEILSNDVLPWHKMSNYFPTCVSSTARQFGETIQKLIHMCYAVTIIIAAFFNYYRAQRTYSQSYSKSDCSQYYVFSFTNFTHSIVYNHNITNAYPTGSCDNTPFYFLGIIATEMIRVFVCICWLYSIDSRYGILKWKNQVFAFQMRQKSFCQQMVMILVMILVNLLTAIVLTYIILPTVIVLSILQWVFSIKWIQTCLHSAFKSSEITFFYIFLTIQDVCLVFVSCAINLVSAPRIRHEDDTFFAMTLNCIIHCHLLIYRILHIIIARNRCGVFVSILTRTIPLLVSMWTCADMLLDVNQTIKYQKLAFGEKLDTIGFHISPLYLIASLLSFFAPVMICNVIVMYKRLQPYFDGREINWVLFGIQFLFTIPIYFLLSIILCYIVIPMILFYHGWKTMANGYDDERMVDWDPCNLVSTLSNGKSIGLLDLYGIKNITSRLVPLLAGIEQLGEASVQTILSIVFLYNNYVDIMKIDNFLGILCPISVISVIFSIISFCIGIIWNLYIIFTL